LDEPLSHLVWFHICHIALISITVHCCLWNNWRRWRRWW